MTNRTKASVGSEIFEEETQGSYASNQGETVTFLHTLTYLGQNGTSFNLQYREWGNNQRRQPFDHDLVYENPPKDSLNSFTDIAFRHIKLRVYSVSNLEIEFSILSDNEQKSQ